MDNNQHTSKIKGYGRAAWVAARFLREAGLLHATETVPKAQIIAEAIQRAKRGRSGYMPKGAAKQIVKDFAAELSGCLASKAVPSWKPRQLPKPKPQVTTIAPRSEYKDFYMSEAWRRLRYVVLRASRGVCELCGAAPKPGSPLHVDHIKPRSRFPQLELDQANLQVLCADCNLGKSNIDQIDWRRKAV